LATALTARSPRCSVARSLEVLGDKWTLLVVREAFWGRTRFTEFRDQLGVAPDVLTDRLAKLVEANVLERREYREDGERSRDEYVLTHSGRGLLPVLAALATWGDENLPTGFGPSAVSIDTTTGDRLHLGFLDKDNRPVDADTVAIARGPGALSS
jgi:DNA-binding HxlR family transcriptional regulator